MLLAGRLFAEAVVAATVLLMLFIYELIILLNDRSGYLYPKEKEVAFVGQGYF